MTDKKMTTGGFFRLAARWALGGGTGENPVTTVIKESRKATKDDEGKTVIDATFEPLEGEEQKQHGR